MISEGSCDTEDWNNNAENSTLHHSFYWLNNFFMAYTLGDFFQKSFEKSFKW